MSASCNHVWTTGKVVTGTRYCTKCSYIGRVDIASLRHLLHFTQPEKVLITVEVDFDTTVEVFGEPENGAYEWLLRRNGVIERYSDMGYCNQSIALLDALIAYHGPQPSIPAYREIAAGTEVRHG